MKLRAGALGVCLGLLAGGALAGPGAATAQGGAPHVAQPGAKGKAKGRRVFEVCQHGCRYRTIQRAVKEAGAFHLRYRARRAVVAVAPGRYRETVLLNGESSGEFDGLTIEGTDEDRRRTAVVGSGISATPGALATGIESIGVSGLVIRNLSVRGFAADGILIRAGVGTRCRGFSVENVLAAGNGSDGVAVAGCSGGRISDSAATRNDRGGFTVTTIHCDSLAWTVHGRAPGPCQAHPHSTVLTSDAALENSVGYLGIADRYVNVVESAFYENGVGILTATPPEAGYSPGGFDLFERDDVFWNELNPYALAAPVRADPAGLGEYGGATLALPTGVGIALIGSDGDVVRRNRVFGNPKWGIAVLSTPGGAISKEEGDEAESINNQIVENALGREGADPDGEHEFFGDRTGGGNCWGANSTGADFALGNGKLGVGQIYPVCPVSPVQADDVGNLDSSAGLQSNPNRPTDPGTVIGYLTATSPPTQQCSWRPEEHPAFQAYVPLPASAEPSLNGC